MGIGYYCHLSQNLVITWHAMSSSWEIELLLVAKVNGIFYKQIPHHKYVITQIEK
jgi:hypothetical protein